MIAPPDFEGIGSLSVNEILVKSKSSHKNADSDDRYCVAADWQAKSRNLHEDESSFLNAQVIGIIGSEPKKYNLKEPLPMRSIFNTQYSIPQWPADFPQRRLAFPDFLLTSGNAEPIGKVRSREAGRTPSSRSLSLSSFSRVDAEVVEVFNWKIPIHNDNSLVFESNFECGNLKQAFKIGPFSYNLKVREDINTSGHTQWFFFQITNMVAEIDYEFQISNIRKPNSLYSRGQRPLIYSNHLARVCRTGWKRISCQEISYLENIDHAESTTKPNEKKSKRSTFTLKFKLRFPQTRDTVYIAHCFPFSYSQLQNDIRSYKMNPEYSKYFRHKVMGKSLLGNNLDLLCISSKVDSPKDLQGRQAIIILARVHPGETNSSYFIKGFLKFLLGNSREAQELRNNYVFKIVPMLNPDGVILGNHRCNYNGYDLNRAWQAVIDDGETLKKFPEIKIVKTMISKTARDRNIAFFCDVHGHNKKFEAFLYGCHNNQKPGLYLTERVFPFLLSKQHPGFFSFARSNFAIQPKKQGTARVVLKNEFDVINSFTLEISFAGMLHSHYSTSSLQQMGIAFCTSVHVFVQNNYDVKVMDTLYSIFGGFDEGKDKLELESEEFSDDSSSDDEDSRCSAKKGPKKKVKALRKTFFHSSLAQKAKKLTSATESSAYSNSRPSTPSNWSSSSSIIASPSWIRHSSSAARLPTTSHEVPQGSPSTQSAFSTRRIQIESVRANSSRKLQSATKILISDEIDLKPSLSIQNFEASIIHLRKSKLAQTTTVSRPSSASSFKSVDSRNPKKQSLSSPAPTIVPMVTMIDAELPKGIVAIIYKN